MSGWSGTRLTRRGSLLIAGVAAVGLIWASTQIPFPATASSGAEPAASVAARPTSAAHTSSPASSTPPASTPASSSPAAPATPKVNCRKAKCVAITFDDGPGPYTKKLLGYLKDAQAPATFFMIGKQVRAYASVVKEMAQAGHEIGDHTWDHADLARLGALQIDREIDSTVSVIKKYAGVTPKFLRPPYGAMNPAVHAGARRAGLAMALWNVDTLDWKTRNTKKTVAAAVGQAQRGSIILMHDIHPTTVAAIPAVIKGLRARGFTLVTVSNLVGKTRPGVKYFNG